jgi:hypothetical protein
VRERSGLGVEGERLGLHELGDDIDCFFLIDDVADPAGVLLEQGDDELTVFIGDPRQAERLELGQEFGRTGVARDRALPSR